MNPADIPVITMMQSNPEAHVVEPRRGGLRVEFYDPVKQIQIINHNDEGRLMFCFERGCTVPPYGYVEPETTKLFEVPEYINLMGLNFFADSKTTVSFTLKIWGDTNDHS